MLFVLFTASSPLNLSTFLAVCIANIWAYPHDDDGDDGDDDNDDGDDDGDDDNDDDGCDFPDATYTETSSTTKHISIYHRPSQNSQGAITFATLPVSGNVLLCTCNGGIHLCNRPRSRRIKIGKNAYLYYIHIVYIYSVYIYFYLYTYIYIHFRVSLSLSLTPWIYMLIFLNV